MFSVLPLSLKDDAPSGASGLIKQPAAPPAAPSTDVPGPALLFGPTANVKAPLLAALVNGLVATPTGLEQWQDLRGTMKASPGGGGE